MEHGPSHFPGRNLEDVYIENRSAVLYALHAKGKISRKELAGLTGLNPSTMTHITKELLDKGLIVERGQLTGHKGRRAIALEINPDGRLVIGVRLARTHVSCGLFNLHANPLHMEKQEISSLGQVNEVLGVMKSMIQQALDRVSPLGISAIGISAPGPLSVREGKITLVSNFSGWRNIPLKEIIETEFKIETLIEHDAHAAALAEMWFGSGRGVKDLVFITAQRGVGAGVIVDGRIYHGCSGVAGEIGHTTIDFKGARCECGNYGCLELYCSSLALMRKAQQVIAAKKVKTVLTEASPLTLPSIFAAAWDGDKVARTLLEESATYLGYGLVNLVNTLNPELVILGDEMAEAGDIWVEAIKRVVFPRLLPEVANKVVIQRTCMKEDPVLVGTGTIAIQSLFRNP